MIRSLLLGTAVASLIFYGCGGSAGPTSSPSRASKDDPSALAATPTCQEGREEYDFWKETLASGKEHIAFAEKEGMSREKAFGQRQVKSAERGLKEAVSLCEVKEALCAEVTPRVMQKRMEATRHEPVGRITEVAGQVATYEHACGRHVPR